MVDSGNRALLYGFCSWASIVGMAGRAGLWGVDVRAEYHTKGYGLLHRRACSNQPEFRPLRLLDRAVAVLVRQIQKMLLSDRIDRVFCRPDSRMGSRLYHPLA
jgi:hypothetical protein